MLEKYEYVFVITYGRSGSTLLMKLLNTLDGFEIKGENFNTLYRLYKSARCAQESKAFVSDWEVQEDHPWFGADEIDHEAYTRGCLEAFVGSVLRPAENASTVGFKEIRHMPAQMSDDDFVGYMDFLRESFPGGKIIFNTRDAGQVSRSGWYRDRDPAEVIPEIEATDRRFREYAASHADCFVIDYADMVEKNERLRALYAFLDREPSDEDIDSTLAVPLTHMQGRPPGWRRRLDRVVRQARQLIGPGAASR